MATTTEKKKRSLLRDIRGSEFIEKAIIIGLFALLCVGAVKLLGSKVQDKYNKQAATVETEIPSGVNGGN